MSNSILRYLGIYQLVTGVLGLTQLFIEAFRKNWIESENLSALFVVIGALLFILSIISGFQLYRNTRRGWVLSVVNQSIQVFSFSLGGVSFVFNAGAILIIKYYSNLLNSGIDSTVDFTASYDFRVMECLVCPVEFGVNITAIMLIIILFMKKISKDG